MTVTINRRFPTHLDARMDGERVASIIRAQVSAQNLPIGLTVYEREEKAGGGFGYLLTCGPISVSCRAITRYTVSYSEPEGDRMNHRDEFEAVTAEAAIEECRQFLEARISHARLALAVLSGPES